MKYSIRDDDHQTVLSVEGELDALTAPTLRRTIDDLAMSTVPVVEVNLSNLRLIDSSGVGAIVSLYKRVRASGREMFVVGLTDQPRAIFELLRLDTVFARPQPAPEELDS